MGIPGMDGGLGIFGELGIVGILGLGIAVDPNSLVIPLRKLISSIHHADFSRYDRPHCCGCQSCQACSRGPTGFPQRKNDGDKP